MITGMTRIPGRRHAAGTLSPGDSRDLDSDRGSRRRHWQPAAAAGLTGRSGRWQSESSRRGPPPVSRNWKFRTARARISTRAVSDAGYSGY